MRSGAQNESPLLPFFNPLTLNPAFAGLDKISSFRTGNQISPADSSSFYNLFYATYDTYSDKLKGGVGFVFQQGIVGSINLSTTEFGIMYAGLPRKTKNGSIRFGLNANFQMATKQWTVAILDGIMLDSYSVTNPPGVNFFRSVSFKPRISFLWELPDLYWGIAVGTSLDKYYFDRDNQNKNMPFRTSLYLSKHWEGYRKGLHSLPYNLNTELLLFYSSASMLGRLKIQTDLRDNSLGVFLNADSKTKLYSIGGIGGFAKNNLRLNLAAGAGYSASSQKIGFTGEISLILKVKQYDYSKINPWQPQ